MCNNENSKSCNCIAEILSVINILQGNAERAEECLETCDRGFLGCNTAALKCNTRPVTLYLCGSNTPWTMPISRDNVSCDEHCVPCTNAFRIEKIDGCCATFRALAENPDCDEAKKFPYVATNSFFTLNLECVCCLRCLPDTFVDCV